MNIELKCADALHRCEKVIEEAERLGITNSQFFLDWEDSLNKLSVKNH